MPLMSLVQVIKAPKKELSHLGNSLKLIMSYSSSLERDLMGKYLRRVIAKVAKSVQLSTSRKSFSMLTKPKKY